MCVGTPDLPMLTESEISYKDELVCDHKRKRRMLVAWRSGVPGTWMPGVHANCIHNERAALLMRSLAPLPLPADHPLSGAVSGVFTKLRKLVGAYGGTRWSYLETALSYSGSLRRRYLKAELSLRQDGPLTGGDSYLRAFLKAEKTRGLKAGKPRMIFPRSPRYNLVLGSWLKPFEHWLWGRLTARRLFGGSNTRIVAKGLNPRQRANLIVRKFNQFRDCVCFEVDGKAFEAHVTVPQLKEEHSVYTAAYPRDAGLRRVLSHQLRLSGVTSGGIKFTREGGRASGDFNTGMGNTLIMLSVTVGVLSGYGCAFDILADGDNCLVFAERADSERIVKTFHDDVLLSSGHEFTLEKPVSCIEQIRFGRSAPVFLGHRLGWTMVREYGAVLSGAFVSHAWLREPKFGKRWCRGVASCELSLARGVPLLQSMAVNVLSQTENLREIKDEFLRDYWVLGAWRAKEQDVVEVSNEARVSFERAFGISADEQCRLESCIASCRLMDAPPPIEIPRDSAWDLADPGLYEFCLDSGI